MGSNRPDQAQAPARTARRWRAAAPLAVVAGFALIGLYAYWSHTMAAASPAILPPAGESLGAAGPFSFGVVGDSRGNMTVFEGILRDVQADRADLVLHTGDIVKHCTRRQFDWVLHELQEEGLTIPFCPVAGNHDIDKDAPEIGQRYRLYSRAFGPRRYWFSYGDALFVAFDDATDKATPEDLQWLDATLARHRSDYGLCFVFMHAPPRDPRPGHQHTLEGGADELVSILGKHQVSAVFASHIHGYLEDELAGVPIYISGGAGADLDMPEAGYHYLLCSVEADGTFQVEKRDVAAQTNTDYAEYVFRTKFREDVALFTGTVLLVSGGLSALGVRRLKQTRARTS
jgi:Icc-related predicted phosphoesterase